MVRKCLDPSLIDLIRKSECGAIISVQCSVEKIKMKTEPTPTTFYQYANEEKEYVFCVKGRPFACLTSPHLPTPTASLIGYELVRSLGLKMTDLQFRKFSYAGFKMRTLGKISTAVQFVIDRWCIPRNLPCEGKRNS